MSGRLKVFLAIVGVGYVLDQLTKLATLRWIPLYHDIPVIPGFFNLVHVRNTGAAFGMMRDNNWFFLILAILVLGGMIWFRKTILSQDAWQRLAYAFLTAGILGNVTDRIAHGAVIDFLDFYIGNSHWPAFNVADSLICVAAGILILGSFFSPSEKKPVGRN